MDLYHRSSLERGGGANCMFRTRISRFGIETRRGPARALELQ